MNEEKRSERLCKAYEDAISGIDLRLELERSKSFRKGIYFAFLVLCVAALAGIAGGLICGSVLGKTFGKKKAEPTAQNSAQKSAYGSSHYRCPCAYVFEAMGDYKLYHEFLLPGRKVVSDGKPVKAHLLIFGKYFFIGHPFSLCGGQKSVKKGA